MLNALTDSLLDGPWSTWLVYGLQRPLGPHERARAALHLVDWLGCAIAGQATPEAEPLKRWAEQLAPGPIWACGRAGLQASDAARFHGSLGSLLELDDFPPDLSAAMGISNERLFSAMILVIPPCEKLYKYEYSSEASEDGVDAPLVEDELLQREEQPAGSADGQQDSRADFPSSKKGHSSMTTEVDAPKRASDDSGDQSASKRRGRALYADEEFDIFSEGGKAPVGAGKLPL